MRLPTLLHRSFATVIVALAACTAPTPPSTVDADAQMPEPVRPAASASPRAPALTGLALAVSGGAMELYVIDVDRVRITAPQGTTGGAEADPAAAEEAVRGVLAGLRFWAEDGALMVEGPAPFGGRARVQARGGVLRFRTPRTAGGSAEGTLTAEVRGAEIVGRVAQRSAPGEVRPWTRGAFFRAPLRRVDARDWPPRAPRTLSAERLADGGVLLRWTVPPHAPAGARYLVYFTGDPSRPAVLVMETEKMQYAAPASGARAGSASWYVVARAAGGATSSPSPSATLP
jgi:hypothetical protein